MKTNVFLISTFRHPFRSLLLLLLFGLISFGFITKVVEFLIVQRETETLGSYYRSIGVLENIKDPQSRDVSAGIDLIETSPYFAYGDQRRAASGVMQFAYNNLSLIANTTLLAALPEKYWDNTHNTDIYFIGELMDKEEVKNDKRAENKITIGYYFSFKIDTLLAAYPENARVGFPLSILFMFEGHESAIPILQKMEVGQRYFVRCWFDSGFDRDFYWENTHAASLQIIPLDDKDLWYMPLAKGATIDFNTPEMAQIKNDIDVLIENQHALYIVTTSDMSGIPLMQEASRLVYLTEGRWLNHQDDLNQSRLIVVPDEFARIRGFKLGDEIQLTFRPLTDTSWGLIRDGPDKMAWESYPTYQEKFRIIGLYAGTSGVPTIEFIPNSSLPQGFESSCQPQFCKLLGYGFILNSSRNQSEFVQEYKTPLQELGISLTFLENTGQAYWSSVDPIRSSLSADVSIFGLLIFVALILAVFLYILQHRREYAILRTLGVPDLKANKYIFYPIFFMGVIGILNGGMPAWKYAINQATLSLSTLPTPAGVYPHVDLNIIFLVGLFLGIFLLLVIITLVGINLLAHKPVYELIQGQASQPMARQRRSKFKEKREFHSSRSITSPATESTYEKLFEPQFDNLYTTLQRKYQPSSLSLYMGHHIFRSGFKSVLILGLGLVFLLASGWILQTLGQTQKKVDYLYDNTVVEADIVRDFSSTFISGRVYEISRSYIDSVLKSGFVNESDLEAETAWIEIRRSVSQDEFSGIFPVYAYDKPQNLTSSLMNPASLILGPGRDVNLFSRQWSADEIRKDGIPAIFPASLIDKFQLSIGEKITITDQFYQNYPCVIIGQYSGERVFTTNTIKLQIFNLAGDPILIPLSGLESMERSQTQFSVAHFVLDPKKNRELTQFRADMEKVFGKYDPKTGGIHLIIWDEELRIVVAQLEKNISILQILYPVLLGVSVMIGAGLCFLILLQEAREAALLRMMGVTKSNVRLTLIVEPFLLSIVGVIIGLLVFRFIWASSGLVPIGSLLLGAGIYLIGVLIGLMIGAISVTNKSPMELLQVKE